MSFLLVLEVPDLAWEQADAVERACREPGHWPVVAGPRSRRRREQPPTLWMPEALDGRHLLSDEADWEAPAWDMDRDLLRLLAATIGTLAEHLPQGFAFRATWGGDEVREEREVSPGELRRIVLGSELNQYTRYVVGAANAERPR